MERWRLAALTGWTLAALLGALALWVMRRLGAEIRAANHEAVERMSATIAAQPSGPSAEAWGMHLADEAAQLVEHGFEDQAQYLFAVSGQLLEVAEHAQS